MEVCSQCFADKELSAFVGSSQKKGKCIICDSENVSLLDLSELYEFFQEVLSNVERNKNGKPFTSKIQDDWGLFRNYEIASKILNFLISQLNSDLTSYDNPVEYSKDIVENYKYWYTLKNSIKWERRFFPDLDKLEDLKWDSYFDTQYYLKPDVILYRARVHHQSGLPAYGKREMSCPQRDQAKGGRANPAGIPFLYLCDNPSTVLYEVRASYLDELSVATFKLSRKINKLKIVDFTEKVSLFQPGAVKDFIKSKLLKDIISQDLSKPMRRYDTEIEYVPTQFICEFIKVFTGAGGIQFQSSLHLSGNNLVIFDQDMMNCVHVKLVRVKKLELNSEDIKVDEIH